MDMVRWGFGKCTSQGYVNGKGESRGIWRIKYQRLWMSQYWFSLRFLSQNYLWKLSTFRGYKVIYRRVREKCEKSYFCIIGHSGDSVSQVERVASLSCELTAWPDCIFCLVVLQLSWPFSFLHASHVWHFGDLPIASQSRDLVVRLLWMHTTWVFFTLSHT